MKNKNGSKLKELTMIQKILKITMIVFIIMGIAFSISNFVPQKTDAIIGSLMGAWVIDIDSTLECMPPGTECDFKEEPGPHPEEIKNLDKQKRREFNIKSNKNIEISPEGELLLNPRSFCVTEDNLFIIPDRQAGNIKIYEKNKNFLKLIKTIGRKGYGPGGFVEPTFCFYDEVEEKIGIMDPGIRKIFIYDRIGRTEFVRISEVPCWETGTEIQLQNQRIFVSGFKLDKNETTYDLYYISQTNDQVTFLLPSYYKYGLISVEDYESQYLKKTGIRAIGIYGMFDVYRDGVYFVWEGDLKIIKLNYISAEVLISFGEKPSHYVKPNPSKKLVEGYLKRNLDTIIGERAKMSYVRDIFVSPKYVMVIYEGPFKQDKESNFWLQFYTLDGDFINEVPIPGAPDRRMWLDKNSDILYSLTSKQNEKGTNYSILEYKIFQKKANP